jgi:hypothetical protein
MGEKIATASTVTRTTKIAPTLSQVRRLRRLLRVNLRASARSILRWVRSRARAEFFESGA